MNLGNNVILNVGQLHAQWRSTGESFDHVQTLFCAPPACHHLSCLLQVYRIMPDCLRQSCITLLLASVYILLVPIVFYTAIS